MYLLLRRLRTSTVEAMCPERLCTDKQARDRRKRLRRFPGRSIRALSLLQHAIGARLDIQPSAFASSQANTEFGPHAYRWNRTCATMACLPDPPRQIRLAL